MSFASWKCNSMREFNDEKCIKEVKNFMGHHANREYTFITYILLVLVISYQCTYYFNILLKFNIIKECKLTY